MNFVEITFNKQDLIVFVKNKKSFYLENCSIVICDMDLEFPYYAWDNITIHEGFDCWITPFSDKIKNILLNSNNFHGISVKIYGPNKRLIQYEKFEINKNTQIISDVFHAPTHDDVGASYVDFFFGNLCKSIDTTGVIIDAGANVGFFTLYCKKNGSKRIYSIEPDPLPFYYLQKNFKNDSSVILINKVLSTHNDNIKFEICLKNSVGSSVDAYKIENNDKLSITTKSINIQTILNIENKINLVKLDIEGEEFNVIEQLPITCFERINQFFIEFHNYPTSILEKLLSVGYEYQFIDSDEMSEVGFIYAKRKKFIK